jgi:hypothetical protein
MKAFLIRYSLNYQGYTGLIALVYADTYSKAVKKLEKNQTKIGDAAYEKAKVISHYNLTIGCDDSHADRERD